MDHGARVRIHEFARNEGIFANERESGDKMSLSRRRCTPTLHADAVVQIAVEEGLKGHARECLSLACHIEYLQGRAKVLRDS